MRINKVLLYIYITMVSIILFSCNKKEPSSNPLEDLRKKNNEKVYSKTKLDSAEAINIITKQKLQEVYDLAAIYSSGRKDSEIDTLNYNQIQGYFIKKDSANIKSLLKEIDSLKAKSVKINELKIKKSIKEKDTTDYAFFDVEYKDADQKKIAVFNKIAQYKLIKLPQTAFKFYFVKVDVKPKDTISVGNTKKSNLTSSEKLSSTKKSGRK